MSQILVRHSQFACWALENISSRLLPMFVNVLTMFYRSHMKYYFIFEKILGNIKVALFVFLVFFNPESALPSQNESWFSIRSFQTITLLHKIKCKWFIRFSMIGRSWAGNWWDFLQPSLRKNVTAFWYVNRI